MHLRFRELREERKLSQAEMAKILHVSQQTYSRYESHKTEIPLEKLKFSHPLYRVARTLLYTKVQLFGSHGFILRLLPKCELQSNLAIQTRRLLRCRA